MIVVRFAKPKNTIVAQWACWRRLEKCPFAARLEATEVTAIYSYNLVELIEKSWGLGGGILVQCLRPSTVSLLANSWLPQGHYSESSERPSCTVASFIILFSFIYVYCSPRLLGEAFVISPFMCV